MFTVRRLMYYYQSKADEFGIISLKERCAEENYDQLYADLVNKFLRDNNFLRRDFYPIKENLNEEDFMNEWQKQFKDGSSKLEEIQDKFYKNIIKQDRKKQFTDLLRLYLRSHTVPLNEIINYFK